ncbi:cysteine proteinase [Flagelloscypha sp. PMI_526]|nr:cysteine proteinase [Flagelloscypha sp. PMI_526]
MSSETTANNEAPVSTESTQPIQITEDTDLSTLSTQQLYDLNQAAFNDAVPNRPYIAEVTPISVLRAEYEGGSPSFVSQIDLLKEKGYHSIRRTRGDGDCFYRSIGFAYIHRLLIFLTPFLLLCNRAGFQEMVYEDFYETFLALIIAVAEKGLDEKNNSVVVFLRLATSAQIRADPETFAPFLLHPDFQIPIPPREFCENFVEATGKEADHVQMAALAKILKVNFDIAYLDGRSSTNIDFVPFRGSDEDQSSPLTLLYRPGHYDLLPPPVKQ